MSTNQMKTIGVFTSGGDAPGMNAAIRSVARSALGKGLSVKGILSGYNGMVHDQIIDLDRGSMANIIQRGGTILKTGRCLEFHSADVRAKAAENLKKHNIDSLVCIGGDGSFRGAHLLSQEHGIRVIGVPGTIDNDIFGTEYTIGFDTAINVAMESIDRIRDTAASHDRLFIVEVMGRHSGFIATYVGLAAGAEEIFFEQNNVTINDAIEHIKKGMERGKTSSILITAEGKRPGRAYEIAREIETQSGFEAKVCVLGHIQRGGNPTALDRFYASQFGAFAVESLLRGESDKMVGLVNNKMQLIELGPVFTNEKLVDMDLIRLAQDLSV